MNFYGYAVYQRLYWNDAASKEKILAFIDVAKEKILAYTEENDPDAEYIEHEFYFESKADYELDDYNEYELFGFYTDLLEDLEKNGIHYEMNLASATDDGIDSSKYAFNGIERKEKSYLFDDEDCYSEIYDYLSDTVNDDEDVDLVYDICMNWEDWEHFSDESKENYMSGGHTEEECREFIKYVLETYKEKCDEMCDKYYDASYTDCELFEFEDFASKF